MKKVQIMVSITLASVLISSSPLISEAHNNRNNTHVEHKQNKEDNQYNDYKNKNEDKSSEKEKEKEKAEETREKEEEKAEKEKEKAEEAREKAEEKAEEAKEKAEEKAEEAKEKAEEKAEKEKNKSEKENNKGQDNKNNKEKNDYKNHEEYRQAKQSYIEKKKNLNNQEKELRKQIGQANRLGDQTKIQEIKTQLDLLQKQRIEMGKEVKDHVIAIKQSIKEKYNNRELKNIEKIGNEIENKYKDIKALGVENIYVKGSKIKFDTPAVIKDNRTLIPVRALTESFGATVDWNQENKTATIVKGNTRIELKLDNKTAKINGKQVQLDVPSSAYSNRTYVPLRFIIENLGLDVDYDQESGLIEIEESK